MSNQILVGAVLPLCRDAVGIFYSPSRLVHRILIGVVLPLNRDAVGVFCSPSGLIHRTLTREVLTHCRDAVGIFCIPSRLVHRILVGGVLPLNRDTVCAFYSPSGLVYRIFKYIRKVLGVLSIHQFLVVRKIAIPEQLHYLSNLVLPKFFFFPRWMKSSRETVLKASRVLKWLTTTELRNISKEFFQLSREARQTRMEKGIILEGDYIKGKIK